MKTKYFVSAILLAGGTGTRMGGSIPKQFRILKDKPLALYSFDFFLQENAIDEIIVVCEDGYQSLFSSKTKPIRFAKPGLRRQDSVYQGLLATDDQSDLISVHDAARPFLEKKPFTELLAAARLHGAAALAIPATNTIKRADPDGKVLETLPRHELWELQTPQVILRDLFLQSYAYAHEHFIEATDDLSLIEAMGKTAVLVKSSPSNFKITTPTDWHLAEICVSN